MSEDAMHMVQIQISARGLALWAAERRMDGDTGYACHAAMCDAYGELRPQPFRVEENMGRLTVLGYASSDAATLTRTRRETAEPEVSDLFLAETSKLMPEHWETGRRFAFSVRVAPTRQGRKEDGSRVERDAILFEAGQAERSEVYRLWLEDRLGEAATIETCNMSAFRLRQAVRRRIDSGTGKRPARPITVPDAVFEGTLRVSDPEVFRKSLRAGIGRHKAFGFGALMLRPARAA